MTEIHSSTLNAKVRVLVSEPEESQKEVLCRFLRAWDFQPVISPTAAHAIRRAARSEFSIALMRHDGTKAAFELLRALRRVNSGLEAILIGPHSSSEFATAAFQAGAYDCLSQPLDFRELSKDLNALRESLRQQAERAVWAARPDDEAIWGGMVGASAVMRALFSSIGRLAEGRATVLITGQTGTGKDLAARALHSLAAGSGGPLLFYRCCGVSEAAAEEELFGSCRGAAAAGTVQSAGIFGQSQQGALLLDEIGDLPLSAQQRLEQALQRAEPGGLRSGPARLLVTSRFNLFEAARRGQFCKPLYDRFCKNMIHIPSLAERMEDLPLLSRHFLAQANREFGKQVRGFSSAAGWTLLNYRWPGNVRELENVIGRACLLADGERIEVQDLSIAYEEGRWPDPPARFVRAGKVLARLKSFSRGSPIQEGKQL